MAAANSVDSLADQLEQLGITSKSQAKKFVDEHNHWGCARCPQVYDSDAELRAHLVTEPKHRYGQQEVRADRERFNERVGVPPESPLKPREKYEEDRMTPAVTKTYYRIIEIQAQLVHLRD
eukprot:m.69828 g.69828  ORF g.69828 m.69828 type:complete len:121 (+) comp9982_c0_seq2:2644-3006(+)